MLTSNSQSPIVSQTTVTPNITLRIYLIFFILSRSSLNLVSKTLVVLSVSEILLSVEEPKGDVESNWVGNNLGHLLGFSLVQVSGSSVWVKSEDLNLCKILYFANHDGESSSDTLDVSQTEWQLLSALDVCVQNTENVLKLSSSFVDETHAALIFLKKYLDLTFTFKIKAII